MRTQVKVMKKMRNQKASLARRARVLPDDACPACGTQMVERRGTLRLPVNGEEIAVPSAAHLHCRNCGEVVLRFQDPKRLGEDAIAIYRRKHGLLSADEIRRIRDQFNLTQTDPWRVCSDWERTQCPGGNQRGTFRLRRWTSCFG